MQRYTSTGTVDTDLLENYNSCVAHFTEALETIVHDEPSYAPPVSAASDLISVMATLSEDVASLITQLSSVVENIPDMLLNPYENPDDICEDAAFSASSGDSFCSAAYDVEEANLYFKTMFRLYVKQQKVRSSNISALLRKAEGMTCSIKRFYSLLDYIRQLDESKTAAFKAFHSALTEGVFNLDECARNDILAKKLDVFLDEESIESISYLNYLLEQFESFYITDKPLPDNLSGVCQAILESKRDFFVVASPDL